MNSNNVYNIVMEQICIKKLKHILIIGAYEGNISIPISSHINKVTTVEPYPSTYDELCKNIKLNNLTNITPLNLFLGNNEELFCYVDDPNNNSKNNQEIKIQVKKSDNINVDNFDIVLITFEGCELEFLQGAREKIIKNKPIIIIEIWNDEKRLEENLNNTRDDVIEYILNMDYTMIKSDDNYFIYEPTQ
jgi:FkbM family methyltransferase